MKNAANFIIFITLTMIFAVVAARAQTTEFTYQGQLQTSGNPASGNFDFEFALFDSLSGGGQIGSTQTRNNVAVSNGSFSVTLDFGSQFPGAERFLEIRVRQTGGGGLTTLAPRQKIMSAPYGVKALNAENAVNAVNANNATTASNALSLGGVAANQYVLTGDVRLSDARIPLPNSPNYIQNTTTPQATSNFNISGNGTIGGTLSANIVNAAAQFNLGGSRILSNAGFFNLFAGVNAGQINTTGGSNTFFGANAGSWNTTGSGNSFFGKNAGNNNTTGNGNAFFGSAAGHSNTTGSQNAFFGMLAGTRNTLGFSNSFFGSSAGDSNTTGTDNSFFGRNAGYSNTIGESNSFFGTYAGFFNESGIGNSFFGWEAGTRTTTGGGNTFFGFSAGRNNTTGVGNTTIGTYANVGEVNLTNSTAIGFQAYVTQSNSLILGSINDVNAATADTKVGIGTTAPTNPFTVFGNGVSAGGVSGFNEVVARFRQRTSGHLGISIDSVTGSDPILYLAENGAAVWGIRNDAGSNTFQIRFHQGGANTTRFSISSTGNAAITGTLSISTLGTAGATPICRNASNQISTCSSSMRYKSNIESFRPGLSLIRQLRPVSFNWTEGGMLDLGLVAEDVAKVEPLLTTQNDKGETEGVKYDRVGIVLVNAVNEQQSQIEAQQNQINEQKILIEGLQTEMEILKTLVCSQNPALKICRKKEENQ